LQRSQCLYTERKGLSRKVSIMQVTMSYGRQGLILTFPNDWQVDVVNKKVMPVLDDPQKRVAEALNNPVGCRPLKEEARDKKSACILICDITRPVPNELLLPQIIRELMAGGMEAARIKVLVATGLHRPNKGDELRELVGDDWVMKTVSVENHLARNDEDHLDLGLTKKGTRVKIDKRFVKAELRIVTGLVEPHFMAGYSGGRKVITPGVAHQDTISRLHTALFLEHPGAANCVLDGNPLHEEQLEVVDMLGGALSVNTVITEQRELSFVNFGEIKQSHLKAVEHARLYTETTLPQAYQTVITSNAGYPLDKTFYQTVKGMVGAMEIVKPGGDIFIVSEISEGFGSPEYRLAQKRLMELGAENFLREIKTRDRADIDEWETEKLLKPMRKGLVRLFTQGLTPEEERLTGIEVINDLAKFNQAVRKSGNKEKRVVVIPEGPYIIPFIRG